MATTGGPVRGVLFDLGGTLFSYAAREGMGRANIAVFERLGLDPAMADVREARRVASEEVALEYAARTSFLHRDLFRDRVTRAAAVLGVTVPDDVLEQFRLDNARAILEHMQPRADAAATLAGLRDRGIYRAVVSNADDEWLEPPLARHGLDVLLDDWTSSEEAASCKPDGRIFAYSLAKAALAADDVLFVGDSLPHDIGGAHRAGIRSVLIAADSDLPTPLATGLDASVQPDFEIATLSDLIPIVDTLNR